MVEKKVKYPFLKIFVNYFYVSPIIISVEKGVCMIKCKKINGQTIYINAELIEFLEETPDTIISTTTGKKILVLDSIQDVIEEMIKYKKKIFEGTTINLSGEFE